MRELKKKKTFSYLMNNDLDWNGCGDGDVDIWKLQRTNKC